MLMEIWRSQQRERRNYRGLTLQSSLPVARYSLFAACRPDELAFEYPFENREPQGALTYWLLDTLRRSSGELSCGEIHQRLVARIRGFFATQTPMFLGDGERGFLAVRKLTRDAAVDSPRVLRVDEKTGQALINIGLFAGAKVGDRIRLEGAAELTIRRIGATDNWAEITRVLGPGAIEPGARAEFLRLQTSVRLVPPERENREAEQALARVRDSLQKSPGGFVEACENGTAPDLCVTIDENRAYQVLDPGGIPFQNLSPLRINAPGVTFKLLQRLDHLAKFRNILSVENPRPAEWLRIGLEVREDGPEGSPVELSSRAVELGTGESLRIRIVNRSSVRLDFVVFNLAPDYSVTQLLPKPGSLTLLPLDRGEGHSVSIRGWLPPGYGEGKDILKVFATQGAANFRWLQLPALDSPARGSNFRGDPKNPLERLFAQLAARKPAKRGPLVVSAFPQEEWITAQVEIRVRR